MYKLSSFDIHEILHHVKSADIIVIDGYESVGKHYYLNKIPELLKDEFPGILTFNFIKYRPDFELLPYTTILESDRLFVLRIPAIEMFNQMNLPNTKLIIDRSLFSDLVSLAMLNDLPDFTEDIFETYHRLFLNKKVAVIYLMPDDIADDEYGRSSHIVTADILYNRLFDYYQNKYPEDMIEFIKFFIMRPEPEENTYENFD